MASTRPAATTETPSGGDPLVAAIAARLPGLRVLAEAIDRESYRLDETPYLHPGLPRAVVFPTSTADVVELVRIAGELGVPIVPRGAGTGLSGGVLPPPSVRAGIGLTRSDTEKTPRKAT